jgi:hypothetical protein
VDLWMLAAIIDRMSAGKGKDRALIEQHLNEPLKKRIPGWYRTLLSVSKKGEMNDICLNGSDVKMMYEDMADPEKEHFFKAVRKTCSVLGIDALSTPTQPSWGSGRSVGGVPAALGEGAEGELYLDGDQGGPQHRKTFWTEIHIRRVLHVHEAHDQEES